MRLEQLEYIVTLSKCSSLSEASEKLFIKQQSLGKAIRDLEEELGVSLLSRSNKGSNLTIAGLEVVQQSRDIIQKVEELKYYFRRKDNGLIGEIIILGCQASYQGMLAAALNNFSAKHEEIIVTVMERDSYFIPTLYNQIATKTQNIPIIGIVNLPMIDGLDVETLPDNLKFIPCKKGSWGAVLNNKHPLTNYKKIPIQSMLKEKFVLNCPDFPETGIDYAILSYFGNPVIKKTVSNIEFFLMAIEKENCIGITSDFFLEKDDSFKKHNLVYREISPAIESMLGILIDKKYINNPIVEEFITSFKNI